MLANNIIRGQGQGWGSFLGYERKAQDKQLKEDLPTRQAMQRGASRPLGVYGWPARAPNHSSNQPAAAAEGGCECQIMICKRPVPPRAFDIPHTGCTQKGFGSAQFGPSHYAAHIERTDSASGLDLSGDHD